METRIIEEEEEEEVRQFNNSHSLMNHRGAEDGASFQHQGRKIEAEEEEEEVPTEEEAEEEVAHPLVVRESAEFADKKVTIGIIVRIIEIPYELYKTVSGGHDLSKNKLLLNFQFPSKEPLVQVIELN